MNEKVKCDNCWFYVPDGGTHNTGYGQGHCRKKPPSELSSVDSAVVEYLKFISECLAQQTSKSTPYPYYSTTTGFPVVNWDTWCGEFEERDDKQNP